MSMESGDEVVDLGEVQEPTPELSGHRDVVERTSKPGRRVRSRLEGLTETGYITPPQAAAGRRFTIDHHRARAGSNSCLNINPSRSEYVPEARIDSGVDFANAVAALDGNAMTGGGAVALPSQVLIAFCVHDMKYPAIGQMLRIIDNDQAVRSRISAFLAILALHYETVDRERGRTSTPHTKEAAIRLFDPDAKLIRREE